MEKVYITNSAQETTELARKIVKQLLHKSKILALYGELGSGKTTFVQGLARGLGIKRRIISPTFVIVRSYRLGVRSFYHIDLYRIESEGEIDGLGLEEIINDKQNMVAIEWAEKIKDLFPKERVDIYFEYLNENERKIWIETWKKPLKF